MKHMIFVLFFTFAAAYPALAQAQRKELSANSSIEQQLIELEAKLSDALIREDAVTLNRLWSDDLVFTFPNGKVSGKAQRLAGLKASAQPSQSDSDTSNTNDEVKVHLYENMAVVTVQSTWRGKVNNQRYSEQYQATHVWAKQQGHWQLVAAHVSQVKK